jgi:hypothetical protein
VSLWWILILASATQAQQIQFRDIAAQAGIHFMHNNGAFGKKWLPETMGPGCAFIDYDNDGYPDILLVNGEDFPGHAHGGATTPKLYHNNGNGTFTDVTRKAGLAVPMFGMGAAVGDYDNDGFDDIFITALGQSHLFRNNGNGTFTDVTKTAGLFGPSEFSTSAAWVDYDRDGKLDLVVANYVQWTEQGDLYCTLDGAHKSYCTPESYKGTSVRLWHNLGGGKFEDTTQKAGLGDPTSKSLGITILDYNGDGWPDILIANDTQPNKLYLNKKDGTFEERGVAAGIGFSEDGVARAGMGVDAADYDRSGHASVLITNFANQMASLYHNEGNGLFVDEAPQSEVGRATLVTLGFGCFFFDYDNDGWPDIFVAGYSFGGPRDLGGFEIGHPYRAETPRLYRNKHDGTFEDVSTRVRLDRAIIPMGANFGDLDNDGWLDIYLGTGESSYQALLPNRMFRNDRGVVFQDVTTSGGFGNLQKGHGVAFGDLEANGNEDVFEEMGGAYPGDTYQSVLYHNPGHGNHWLTIALDGVQTNRAAFGTRICLTIATANGPRHIYRTVGYVSSFGGNPLRQHIGIGSAQKVEKLEVTWPTSHLVQTFTNINADQSVSLREGDKALQPAAYLRSPR